MYRCEPIAKLNTIPRRALLALVAQRFGDASYRIVYNNLILFTNDYNHKPSRVIGAGFVFYHNGEYFLCMQEELRYVVDEGEHIVLSGTGGTEMAIFETDYGLGKDIHLSITCQFWPDDNPDLSMVLV